MTVEDVPAVDRLTDDAYYELDVRTHRPGTPPPTHRSPEKSVKWQARTSHSVSHDPAGCFVAEDGSGLIGVVVSLRRDMTWILSTFAVRPSLQGRGVGRQLLDAALGYGRGCLRGLFSASLDQGALRRYRAAGFSLQPMMSLTGPVPRALLPVVERVREGSAGDVDLMNSVDRQVRDAAHGVDHEILTRLYRLVVVDRPTGSGYVYVGNGGGPYLLAATSRRTATDLLWESLAASTPDHDVTIGHVSAPNEWALDVGMAARMALHVEGFLATRHMKPPAPYLPSGTFL
jgi:GNAT superfamily N-acetyltransferase